MTLPLPVVPDPMGTTEGPVRPAAPSARLTVAEWLRFGPFLAQIDRKSTRLNSSHSQISYAVFCLKKKQRQCNLVVNVRMLCISNRRAHAFSFALSWPARVVVFGWITRTR